MEKKNKDEFGRVFACSTVGNIVEWYDFATYGALSDILGQKFFPKSSKAASLMESLAVFGAAFFMRPIGGMFFGYVGDTIGRKRALEISICVMVIPSFCIGLLPTYSSIGFVSTLLLIFLRLLQGLAVGGELVTAYVFVAERSPNPNYAPGYTALVLGSANFGTLTGIASVAIMRLILSERATIRYGWRICFFLSLPLGIFGFILRRSVGESQVFSNKTQKFDKSTTQAHNPLRTALQFHFRTILLAAGVASMWCGGFYSVFIWLGFYYNGDAGGSIQPLPYGAAINAILLVFLCLLFLPFAYSTTFSQKTINEHENQNMTEATQDYLTLPDTNARRALKFGQLGFGLCSLPAFAILQIESRRQICAVVAQGTLAVSLASFGCGLPFFLVQAFPVDCRVAGIGASYNLSQALFASAAPIVMTALLSTNPLLPGLALVILAFLSFVALHTYEFDRKRELAKPSLGPEQAISYSFTSSKHRNRSNPSFSQIPSDNANSYGNNDDGILLVDTHAIAIASNDTQKSAAGSKQMKSHFELTILNRGEENEISDEGSVSAEKKIDGLSQPHEVIQGSFQNTGTIPERRENDSPHLC